MTADSDTGPRHRLGGGPRTPAGIPVISLPPVPALNMGTRDGYATDRLPIVGGPLDPGARHALADIRPAPTPGGGPATDRFPTSTGATRPAPAAAPAPLSPRGPASTPTRPAPHGLTPSLTPVAVHAPTTSRASTAASQAPAAYVPGPDPLVAQHDPDPSRPAPDYGGDDEVFARMINRSKRRRPPRWAAPLAASMAGALLIGGGYFQLRGPAPESAAASSPIGAGSAPAPGSCPAEQVGGRIQGNGPGGTENGVAAILAFQHAYYVARSGDQARTLVSRNADLPSGADIQAGIDTIPAGTTHCLSITPAADAGQYFVEITEFRPDEVPITYNPQLVGTAEVGGKYLITSIGPAR